MAGQVEVWVNVYGIEITIPIKEKDTAEIALQKIEAFRKGYRYVKDTHGNR